MQPNTSNPKSNRLWIKVEDDTDTAIVDGYTTKVTNLDDDADVDDLKKELGFSVMGSKFLQVFETDGGVELKSGVKLRQYYIPDSLPSHHSVAPAAGPGQLEETALLVKISAKGQKKQKVGLVVEMTKESLCNHILSCQQARSFSPHAEIIHRARDLAYQLQDREDALAVFTDTIVRSSESLSMGPDDMPGDRTQYPMPVFSGMKGLGKTRMLEEWKRVFEKVKVPWPYTGLIVTYGNGHSVSNEDKELPIESSFGWRMLHRLFVLSNAKEDARAWNKPGFLPTNAKDLTLPLAISVVDELSKSLLQGDNTGKTLSLFIGIDEYQKIPKGKEYEQVESKIDKNAKDFDRKLKSIRPQSLLWRLIDHLQDSRYTENVRIYPAFAGTAFCPLSVDGSSVPTIKRAPMRVLTPGAMEDAVYSTIHHNLLDDDQFRRELFFLGGIPRPSIEYVESVASSGKSQFDTIWDEFIKRGWQIKTSELLLLISYAVSMKKVSPEDYPGIESRKWAALEDQGLCIVRDEIVTVPYCVFRLAASKDATPKMSLAEKCLLQNLKFLVEMVDRSLYCSQPWQQWEYFGACFFAMRNNTFLILGERTVRFNLLCKNAVNKGCFQWVDLMPMQVRKIRESLSKDLPETVTSDPERDDLNWKSGDNGVRYCLLNGDSGEGVDIFTALNLHKSPEVLFYADQRKREATALGDARATGLLSKAKGMKPLCLGDKAECVVGLFSLLATYKGDGSNLIENSFVLSYKQYKSFYGCLSSHPACSPVVDVNFCNISTLRMLKSVRQIADPIVQARSASQFVNLQQFAAFCKANGQELSKEDEERCLVYSSN